MKKLSFFLICILLISTMVFAQSPQSIPYQSVVRNSQGTPLPNKHIALRLTIHNASSGGTVLYQERDTTTSSLLGLFTISLGTGSVLSGTFSTIDWKDSTKFLQVELDTTGGTSYNNMGTTQMQSVPYALYSGKSGNGIDVAKAPLTLSHDTISTSLGGWVLLATATASNSASIQFTGISNTYNTYVITISDVVSAAAVLYLRVGTGGPPPAWQSTSGNYYYNNWNTSTSSVSVASQGSKTDSGIKLGLTNNSADESLSGIVYVINPSQTTVYHNIIFSASNYDLTVFNSYYGTATFASTTAITGLELILGSGNITSGTFKLYGIN